MQIYKKVKESSTWDSCRLNLLKVTAITNIHDIHITRYFYAEENVNSM